MSILISQFINVQLDLTSISNDELMKLQLRLAAESTRRINKNPDELDEAEKHLAVTQGRLAALNAYKARVETQVGVKDAVQLIDDYIRSLQTTTNIQVAPADKPAVVIPPRPVVAGEAAKEEPKPMPEKPQVPAPHPDDKVVKVAPPATVLVEEKKSK